MLGVSRPATLAIVSTKGYVCDLRRHAATLHARQLSVLWEWMRLQTFTLARPEPLMH